MNKMKQIILILKAINLNYINLKKLSIKKFILLFILKLKKNIIFLFLKIIVLLYKN
jgi:hypothetical protein